MSHSLDERFNCEGRNRRENNLCVSSLFQSHFDLPGLCEHLHPNGDHLGWRWWSQEVRGEKGLYLI